MRHPFPLQWFLGYLLVQFATLPLALPCWNRFLRDSLGRVLTGEQLHLLEYAGLGALAAWSAHACGRWRVVASLAGLVIGAGLLDEGLQILLPQRVFEWSDVLLNWTGAILGWGIGGIFALRTRLSSSAWWAPARWKKR